MKPSQVAKHFREGPQVAHLDKKRRTGFFVILKAAFTQASQCFTTVWLVIIIFFFFLILGQ
jgi:hypothetical protein